MAEKTTNYWKTIGKALDKAEQVESLTASQLAGLRSTLKKLENGNYGELNKEAAKIVAAMFNHVGRSEERKAAARTWEDIVATYERHYAGMSVRQRGAFKAGVTRWANARLEEGDTAAHDTAVAFLNDIDTAAEKAQVDFVVARASFLFDDEGDNE